MIGNLPRIAKEITIVRSFIRRIVPAEGRTLRFYYSLAKLFVGNRQNIYREYRLVTGAERKSRVSDFLRSLAAAADSERTATPALLFARLLRTVYLTEVVPRSNSLPGQGGPNSGYIDDPDFTYGKPPESAVAAANPHNE